MGLIKNGADALFILLGASMIPAMHAGFAFPELGTVREKNQVNAPVKILVDFAVSTIAYCFVGCQLAYGVNFFGSAETRLPCCRAAAWRMDPDGRLVLLQRHERAAAPADDRLGY